MVKMIGIIISYIGNYKLIITFTHFKNINYLYELYDSFDCVNNIGNLL